MVSVRPDNWQNGEEATRDYAHYREQLIGLVQKNNMSRYSLANELSYWINRWSSGFD